MIARPRYRFLAPMIAFAIAVSIAIIAKTVKPAVGGDAAVLLDLTRPADATRGAKLFSTSCAQCHGTAGRGMPRQGPTLKDSRFVAGRDDRQLVAFVRHGRSPGDADSVMGQSMPPRGGVASYTDNDLNDIVAHVRTLQQPPGRLAMGPVNNPR